MKKIATAIAMIALAAVMASPATAYRGMRAGYGGGPGNVADIGATRGLDLTAEQTGQINSLREAQLKEIEPLQDQMLSKSRELRRLWLEATPDQEKITALRKEAQNLRDQLTDKRATYRLEIMKILTPEQQAKVQAYGAGRGMATDGRRSGHDGRPRLRQGDAAMPQ